MPFSWSEMKFCHAVNWWQNKGNFNMKLYQKFLQVRYLETPKKLINEQKKTVFNFEKRAV
jgi:hypothetical protein